MLWTWPFRLDGPQYVRKLLKNTRLAVPGALAHACNASPPAKCKNGPQGVPKWPTGSGKVSTHRSTFAKYVFWSEHFFCEKKLQRRKRMEKNYGKQNSNDMIKNRYLSVRIRYIHIKSSLSKKIPFKKIKPCKNQCKQIMLWNADWINQVLYFGTCGMWSTLVWPCLHG